MTPYSRYKNSPRFAGENSAGAGRPQSICMTLPTADTWIRIRDAVAWAVLLFLMLAAFRPLTAATDPAKEIMEKAKLDIFDRKWDAALEKLENIIQNHSASGFFPRALFYKGKCLKEKKQYKEAVRVYRDYLKISEDDALAEDATIDIIEISFSLWEKGENANLKEATSFLSDENTAVRYFTAFKLSYARDKKVANLAVPVLKKIIETSEDPELTDRAKVALMRINPALLEKNVKGPARENAMFYLSMTDKKTGKISFSISFPFALAKLALESLPEKDREAIGREGYNIDSILRMLTKNSEIIKVDTGDSIVRIWVK